MKCDRPWRRQINNGESVCLVNGTKFEEGFFFFSGIACSAEDLGGIGYKKMRCCIFSVVLYLVFFFIYLHLKAGKGQMADSVLEVIFYFFLSGKKLTKVQGDGKRKRWRLTHRTYFASLIFHCYVFSSVTCQRIFF